MIYYILILLLWAVLMSHSMLREDFSEYKRSYRKMVEAKEVIKEDNFWYFPGTDIWYSLKNGGFFLENDKELRRWFPTWLHPYPFYWIIKYQSHIRKLRKNETNQKLAGNC